MLYNNVCVVEFGSYNTVADNTSLHVTSLIRSHYFLSSAILTFVSSAVCVLTLILKQPVPTVHSKLDYCNSLYYNLPKSQINRLQQIQNCLARSVVKTPKSSHITPILRSLHWLKINDRIEYTSLIRSLSSPITASTFHSRLITHLFHKSFPP